MHVPDSRFHAERVLSTQKLRFSCAYMYIHVHTCTHVTLCYAEKCLHFRYPSLTESSTPTQANE